MWKMALEKSWILVINFRFRRRQLTKKQKKRLDNLVHLIVLFRGDKFHQ